LRGELEDIFQIDEPQNAGEEDGLKVCLDIQLSANGPKVLFECAGGVAGFFGGLGEAAVADDFLDGFDFRQGQKFGIGDNSLGFKGIVAEGYAFTARKQEADVIGIYGGTGENFHLD